MLTVIATNRTLVLVITVRRYWISLKIVPTVLKEEGCHGHAPMVDCAAGVSFQFMALLIVTMIQQVGKHRAP